MKRTGNKFDNWIERRLLIYLAFCWLSGLLFIGVSCCPKVCVCKWKGGKQWVTCSNAKFIDIPRGLEPSTQALNLEHNKLKILFRDAFVDRGLVNLQKVFITFCQLRQLEKGSFRKLANLVELDVSFNFLKFVPSDALIDVPGLRELRLRSNNITSIPTESFKGTPDLVLLDLGFNGIKAIEDRSFSFLSKLEVLDLAGNKLVSLSVRVFHPLVSLHGLYVHANPWHCNCMLRSLRHWMLERNIAAPVPPTCTLPRRLENSQWESLQLDEFVCVPHVTAIAPRVLASNGDNVTLACRVETDADAKVTWLMGDKPVAKGVSSAEPRYKVLELLVPDHGNASRVSNLRIAGADLHDQGTYRCVVENKAGRVETNLTLKVSEVISEDPLVEIDQVFVAGALLGGLTFVLFAIFIACAVFYKRKRRHAENIARMNIEMRDSSINSKISDKSDSFKVTTRSEYANYQILPTSDSEIPFTDCKIRKLSDAANSATIPFVEIDKTELYSGLSEKQIKDSSLSKDSEKLPSCDTSKTSLLPEDPLLQNLALQCKNEALKRQKYSDISKYFSNHSSNHRFPDLLASEHSEFQYCTLPRGMRNQRPVSENLSVLKTANDTRETSLSSILENPTSRSSSTLRLKEASNIRKTPSLPSTPLQTHLPWDKISGFDSESDISNRYSSFEPFDYEFHASQLEHFLQEYKSLQDELYRMKETAVEAPEEIRSSKITSRPITDTESRWTNYVPLERVPSPALESPFDHRTYGVGESCIKSTLIPVESSSRRSSLTYEDESTVTLRRDFKFNI